MPSWIKAIALPFIDIEHDSSLVRMFRIEYGSEYEALKKSGYAVDDTLVRQFLQNARNSSI